MVVVVVASHRDGIAALLLYRLPLRQWHQRKD